jgi:hypothetical protein
VRLQALHNFLFDYYHNKQIPGFSTTAEKKTVAGSVQQDGEGVKSRLS